MISDFLAVKSCLEHTKAWNWNKEILFKRLELRDVGVRQSQLESKYSQNPRTFLPSRLTFYLSSFQHLSELHKHLH